MFFILDATHPDARGYIAAIKAVAGEVFVPRLSLDRTKAIIQVKEGIRGYNTREVAWLRSYSGCVLGAGDAEWAVAQMDRGWAEDTGNDWAPEVEERLRAVAVTRGG